MSQPTARDEREALRERVQRRTLAVVVVSQVLGGAGLAAGISVGALLAEDLLGTGSVAGLPTALFTLGSALTAFLVGRLTQRWGRRSGLGIGFAAGGIGALGVTLAAVIGSVPLLFVSFFVYGAGTATNLLARYAGGDLAPASRRATSISVALVSTTLGAVAGPNLIEPLGRFAEALGIPALTGPFLLAGAAYLLAGATLVVFLRPDPFLLARKLDAAEQAEERNATGPGGIGGVPHDGGGNEAAAGPAPRIGVNAFVGATIMVLTQITMVAIMTMTPVHMRAHGHELDAVGLVISLHVAAMFLPSLLTGWLVDRVGRTGMAIASGVILLAAGLVAALAPDDSLGMLLLALVLLGLGWNVGLIAGTALVVDATVPANRARAQGTIDVLVALAGAGGGAMSGMVMAATSFHWLSVSGGVLALLLIPVLLWARSRREVAPPR
ncbi:putative MFS-type transporter YdeG [Pseudoclavibacter endophyticus]|uniref:MFS transporter n=1 Tax=Pseudoclavibacter endophyticus TaxID=1778590 RepID=A0A6H9WVW5_9MICO|nr:MFS transporter [Pseudoclavibacter endophyticus]KAB1650300.1 MFS transporter [Pseudoclavibacter endophyticus]GGA55325.1 putative MFS-type transporter YdeG [Pseudoclavibacter endophyticus]